VNISGRQNGVRFVSLFFPLPECQIYNRPNKEFKKEECGREREEAAARMVNKQRAQCGKTEK
jgi:hypothetical protein